MMSGGLTKTELISIALESSRGSETFAGIGCGTRSLSIAPRKKRGRYSRKIWDAKSKKVFSWTDRNRQMAVTSLLRHHSPSEAKKAKKSSTQPSIGRVGVGYI